MPDRSEVYRALAEALSRQEHDPNARLFHEKLCDGFVWTDEKLDELIESKYELLDALRPIWHRRTLIICGESTRFDEEWNLLRSLCPEWIGFRPERFAPSADLAERRAKENRRFMRHLERGFGSSNS